MEEEKLFPECSSFPSFYPCLSDRTYCGVILLGDSLRSIVCTFGGGNENDIYSV